MKIKLLYGDDVFNAEWQDKSFKDEISALEFIRKHASKIHGINCHICNTKLLSHFEIIDLIRK
jgi:hypothetical protein